jgi:hypothetical protein
MDLKKWRQKSKCFAIATITAGCLLASSAHAVIVAEVHSCGASSESGNYYSPNTASSRISLHEYTPVSVSMLVDQIAYPLGGGTGLKKRATVTVPGGSWAGGEAKVADEFSKAQSGGNVYSLFLVADPTGIRAYTGLVVDQGTAIGANGCRNATHYF